MEYRNYKSEDFILDPFFRDWVLHPSPKANVFWDQWIKDNEDKIPEIQEAQSFLKDLSIQSAFPSELQKDIMWENIGRATTNDPNQMSRPKIIPLSPTTILKKHSYTRKYGARFWKIAACVAAVLVSSVFLFFYDGRYIEDLLFTSQTEVPSVNVVLKSNPRGQKSTVILPDGTKVQINSASSIRYTEDYNQKDRVIELEGEAYFEVAHDPNRPFIVNAGRLSSTALGTSFNIKAYPNENPRVSLFTGKLAVIHNGNEEQSEILMPGEQVCVSKHDRLLRGTFDISEIYWLKGIISFNNTPFHKAMQELSRWYAVDFDVENLPPKKIRCTGSFENDYLSNVLESLGYSLGFEYEIKDKNVLIKFKPNKPM